MHDASKDEVDILERSTKCNKDRHNSEGSNGGIEGENSQAHAEGPKRSYRDTVTGRSIGNNKELEEEDLDGDVSDDDMIEEGNGVTWFGMGITREEKIATRRP